MTQSEIDFLIEKAVDWIDSNKDKSPQFSSACGMVFNDNSDADEFDSDIGEVAYKNGITIHGRDIPNLYFHALLEISKRVQQ